MAVYTAAFSAVSVSAAQDLWEIATPSDSEVRILEVRFGQYSDAGAAEAELLGVTFRTGDTVSGSGGSTITPTNVRRYTGGATASSTVERNNTTQANTSGVVVWADAWNVQAPFLWVPAEDCRAFIAAKGSRFVVTLTAPADAITMNGTITFEEIGQGPA